MRGYCGGTGIEAQVVDYCGGIGIEAQVVDYRGGIGIEAQVRGYCGGTGIEAQARGQVWEVNGVVIVGNDHWLQKSGSVAQGNIYERILELKTESCSKSKEEELLKETQKPDRKAGRACHIPLTVGLVTSNVDL